MLRQGTSVEWNQSTYQAWRAGTTKPNTTLSIGSSTRQTRQITSSKPDEWLETWIDNVSGNFHSHTFTPSAWGKLRTHGPIPTSNECRVFDIIISIKSSPGTNLLPDKTFLNSFKAVGFTGEGNRGTCSTDIKRDIKRNRSSGGDLVTMKASSTDINCHIIYFPPQYTSRLIGKGGKSIESLRESSKAKKINIKNGTMEVYGSYSVAQAVLVNIRKSLVHFSGQSSAFKPTILVSPSRPLLSSSEVKGKSQGSSCSPYSNRFQRLYDDDTTDRSTLSKQNLSKQEIDESSYNPTVQSGCSWVSHRNTTISLLQASMDETKKNHSEMGSSIIAKRSLFENLSQEVVITILSFIPPSTAIAVAASWGTCNKGIALKFLTCYHRVWGKLASRAWPQLGTLRTKQPLLFPLACAMHQQRIILSDPSSSAMRLNGVLDHDNVCRVMHSIGYNSVCAKTSSQVYALVLEYTINPRTAACDAMKVKKMLICSSLESLKQCASLDSESTSGNKTLLVPCFRGARQWSQLKSYTTECLHSLGTLGRKQYQPCHLSSQDAHLMAPLKPLLVTIKTYMVNTCDGAELDMDAFVAVWRLLLALTNPRDKHGNARRLLVQREVQQFVLGKYEPSDLGNFIPSLLIVDPSQWFGVLKMYLNKTMSKNVMWCCRDLCRKGRAKYVGFFKGEEVMANDEDALTYFLNTCFTSGNISRKSVLFWISLNKAITDSKFLGLKPSVMEKDRSELVHGFIATKALKTSFQVEIDLLMKIDSWERLFTALSPGGESGGGSPKMSDEELLVIMQGCWREGLQKKYFKDDTDFAKIQANGGSNLFLIGNSFSKAAFMIDRSGSMSFHVENTSSSRFEVVTKHLIQMLESKPIDFAFSVQLFDTRIDSFQQGQLCQNTPSNRAALTRFLKINGPRGGTDLVSALQAVLKVKNAEEVFLLTDGCCGDADRLISMAADHARCSEVPIHCIGVALYEAGTRMLQKIASAGQGECCCAGSKQLAGAA